MRNEMEAELVLLTKTKSMVRKVLAFSMPLLPGCGCLTFPVRERGQKRKREEGLRLL